MPTETRSAPATVTSTHVPPELIIERTFAAPRALVWRAYTEPERVARWWGPRHWTLPVCRIDLRPGGVWHYCMRGPNGEEAWGKATYQEIVAPERLVYIDTFSDADGYVAGDQPTMRFTATFVEHDGQTTVTCRCRFASVADLDKLLGMGMIEGFTQSWERLADDLESA